MPSALLDLKSLTYVSVARAGLSARDLADIHSEAIHFNALDGVTGLLVFNGARFAQVIEGVESAIDDLLGRLLADDRHHDLNVRDERGIEVASFPDWSMQLLCLSPELEGCRAALLQKLPKDLAPPIAAALEEVAFGSASLPPNA